MKLKGYSVYPNQIPREHNSVGVRLTSNNITINQSNMHPGHNPGCIFSQKINFLPPFWKKFFLQKLYKYIF